MSQPSAMTHRAVLCADDYAIAPGVSRGIRTLIEAGRLTATSAIVTFSDWPGAAQQIGHLRDRVAIGLHLNLTTGCPLTSMPRLAANGTLPSVGTLIAGVTRALTDRRSIIAEVRQETEAQLAAFEQILGYPPDFVDGHQHVHALPVVRDGVLDSIAARGDFAHLFVRDPADRMGAVRARGGATSKAATISLLARGFRRAAERRGILTNEGFAGFSPFDRTTPYATEFASYFRKPGHRHLVMCHPGHADDVLAARDPLTHRREDELAALLSDANLPSRIHVVLRRKPTERIDWRELWERPAS